MSEYPEHFVRRLELLWGTGFMSPGGPDEVKEIFVGLSVLGSHVLDIGCGIGGPTMAIVSELSARRVTAIDIDPGLIDKARANVSHAGLDDRIICQLISPGPLPFADASFDVVFSKEAFLHVADRRALFSDIYRILRPGGYLAASDWLSSEGATASKAWTAYQQLASYTVVAATAAECCQDLAQAGFVHVSSRDRNQWYGVLAQQHLAEIKGALREQLISVSSQQIYDDWARMREAQTAAVIEGAMRPTHLRAVKPLAS